jgi:hypothetical protein
VRETAAWVEPGSAETAVSGVSGDAGQRREIASGEPGSGGGAGNQTPLACTLWAWLAQKREPNAPYDAQYDGVLSIEKWLVCNKKDLYVRIRQLRLILYYRFF